MTVRTATQEDAAGIARVHACSWQHAYRGIVADGYLDGLSDAVWVDKWRANLESSDRGVRTLVSTTRDGQVVGFASVGPVRDPDPPGPDWAEVYAIYVDPRAWGTGTGGHLLRAALATVPATVPGVCLWVFKANSRARGFYERHGFEADGFEQLLTIGGWEAPEVRYRRLSEPSTTMGE